MKTKTKITVVGAGYVGTSLGALLARKNDVTFLEKDIKKVELLQNKKTHLNENELKKLLKELPLIHFDDFQGTHWQPSLIAKATWEKVNGFSEEFSPGLGSDPDFNMKLWKIGVRIFKGLGKCRVYHFSSISLRNKAWINGAKTFLLKWGISIKFFKKHYLRSASNYNGPLSDPQKSFEYYFDLFITKFKLIYSLVIPSKNEKVNS